MPQYMKDFLKLHLTIQLDYYQMKEILWYLNIVIYI